jgi:hypothetical protein
MAKLGDVSEEEVLAFLGEIINMGSGIFYTRAKLISR